MLDRFAKILGLAEQYPGFYMWKKMASRDYFGGASKVSIFFLKIFTFLFIS
jgi:hypothetical protein